MPRRRLFRFLATTAAARRIHRYVDEALAVERARWRHPAGRHARLVLLQNPDPDSDWVDYREDEA